MALDERTGPAVSVNREMRRIVDGPEQSETTVIRQNQETIMLRSISYLQGDGIDLYCHD